MRGRRFILGITYVYRVGVGGFVVLGWKFVRARGGEVLVSGFIFLSAVILLSLTGN